MAFGLDGRIWLAVICAALLSLIAVATLLVNRCRAGSMPQWQFGSRARRTGKQEQSQPFRVGLAAAHFFPA